MNKTITLNDFVKKNGWSPDQENQLKFVARFFQTGFQETMSLLIGVYTAGIYYQKNVPPGFVNKFKITLTKPVLGNLLQFILWLSSQEISPSFSKLSYYLQKNEKKEKGWLTQMIQLRNQWQHPKDKSREEIMLQALSFFLEMPDFSDLFEIELSDSGELLFSSGEYNIPLEPFIFLKSEKIYVFSEFKIPDRLVFLDQEIKTQEKFSKIWKELRILDHALEDPTPEDFREKALAIFSVETYQGQFPLWAKDIFKKSQIGIVVGSRIIDGILANLTILSSMTIPIDLHLQENLLPAEELSKHLGLAKSLIPQELVSFGNKENPILIILRTEEMTSKGFLKVLYWLADFEIVSSKNHIRIFIGRTKRQLEKDQESLWDRLPDSLDHILQKPYRSKGEKLSDFQWGVKIKKRFFGLK